MRKPLACLCAVQRAIAGTHPHCLPAGTSTGTAPLAPQAGTAHYAGHSVLTRPLKIAGQLRLNIPLVPPECHADMPTGMW